MPEDLDLLKSMNAQGYRFSIAWPRILPDGTGKINNAGLDFYRRLVDGLQQRGISATATLYHWDLPQALQDRGGWENRDSAEWFADYASRVFTALDGVDHWLTINEAKIIATQGYQLGWMAPGKTDAQAAGRVIHHLGLAHGRAVQRFRASATDRNDRAVSATLPDLSRRGHARGQQAAEVADVGRKHPLSRPDSEGRLSPARRRSSTLISSVACDRPSGMVT